MSCVRGSRAECSPDHLQYDVPQRNSLNIVWAGHNCRNSPLRTRASTFPSRRRRTASCRWRTGRRPRSPSQPGPSPCSPSSATRAMALFASLFSTKFAALMRIRNLVLNNFTPATTMRCHLETTRKINPAICGIAACRVLLVFCLLFVRRLGTVNGDGVDQKVLGTPI